MRVEIQTKDLELGNNKLEWLEERIDEVFQGLHRHLQQVELVLCEQRDTKGELETCCLLTLTSYTHQKLQVKDVENELDLAVRRALDRGCRSFTRRVAGSRPIV